MIKSSLVKVQDKLTVVADHNQDLISIWLADKTRPWDTYSRESFRRFWDVPYVEHRTK